MDQGSRKDERIDLALTGRLTTRTHVKSSRSLKPAEWTEFPRCEITECERRQGPSNGNAGLVSIRRLAAAVRVPTTHTEPGKDTSRARRSSPSLESALSTAQPSVDCSSCGEGRCCSFSRIRRSDHQSCVWRSDRPVVGIAASPSRFPTTLTGCLSPRMRLPQSANA